MSDSRVGCERVINLRLRYNMLVLKVVQMFLSSELLGNRNVVRDEAL